MKNKTYVDKFRCEIRKEALEAFDKLDDGVRELYTARQCQMCGAHLTIRQLNRVIIQGLPPVCLKDYKSMKGELEQCVTLFNQLSLL